MVKALLPQKTSRPNELLPLFKKEVVPTPLNIFQKRDKIFPKLFYETSITLMLKPDKDYPKKRKTTGSYPSQS